MPPETKPVEAKPPESPPKAEPKAAVKIERPANCAACNKSIKKKWYYRNGKYFCSKRCWKGTIKKDAKDSVPAA